MDHPKLKETVHGDFESYGGVASVFEGVDACLFCLGVSATQVDGEAAYRKITYDYAAAAAKMLKDKSPDATMVFISGAGTKEKSMWMWARVKAETESALREIAGATSFRPAAIDGEATQSKHGWVSAMKPLMKVLKPFRSMYVSGHDLGTAMLQAARQKMRGRILENTEIRDLADGAGR
jgi:uncharacterized protein YbjT (DUF2867 family)